MECWNSGAALAFAYGEKADQRRESRFSFSSIMGEWSSSFAVGHPICFCHTQRWYDAHEDREEVGGKNWSSRTTATLCEPRR